MDPQKRRGYASLDSIPLEDLHSSGEAIELVNSATDGEGKYEVPRNPQQEHHGRSIAFFRSLRLQIFAQCSMLGKRELPKIAIDSGGRRFWAYLFMHIIPLAVALQLIKLNLSNHFIGHDFRLRTTLQFVSKLFEVWMQGSITAILLSHVNRTICEDVTTFGALFAPKNTTKIEFLWSLEYWSLIRDSKLHRGRRLLTIALILCSISLAAVVGPSSATLMIPRQLTHESQQFNILSLDETPFFLFPKDIREAYRAPISGNYLSGLTTFRMANTTEQELWSWDLTVTDKVGSRVLQTSISVDDRIYPRAFASLPTLGLSEKLWSSDRTSDRSHETWHGWNLGNMSQSRLPNDTSIIMKAIQPSVSVSCATQTWDHRPANSSRIYLPADSGMDLMDGYSFAELIEILFANKTRLEAYKNTTYAFDRYMYSLYLNNPETNDYYNEFGTDRRLNYWTNPPPGTNISAVALRVYLDTTEYYYREDPSLPKDPALLQKINDLALPYAFTDPQWSTWINTTLNVTLCRLDASWQRAVYEFRTVLNVPVVQARITDMKSAPLAGALTIDPHWTEIIERQLQYTLGPKDYIGLGAFNKSLWQAAEGKSAVKAPLELILASTIAEGISNIHTEWHSPRALAETARINISACDEYEDSYCKSPEAIVRLDIDERSLCAPDIDLTDNNCTMISLDWHETGYGYDSSDVAVRLSLAALGAYCFLVIVYILTSCCRGSDCTAWDTPAELVTLALQSKYPEHLGPTSVGINATATFKEIVSVRVNDEERLELIFEDDPAQRGRNLRRIEPGKHY